MYLYMGYSPRAPIKFVDGWKPFIYFFSIIIVENEKEQQSNQSWVFTEISKTTRRKSKRKSKPWFIPPTSVGDVGDVSKGSTIYSKVQKELL